MEAREQEQLVGVLANAIANAFMKIVPVKNIPEFPIGDVPVSVVAEVLGKDASFVRAGIIAGWLPIGNAVRNGEKVTNVNDMDSRKGRITYQISPMKLWEETGFVWNGERTAKEVRERRA